MGYLLGIDQGTTQTTAVVMDDSGSLVARRSARLPVRFPQRGWVEQDPWDILKTVREAAAPLAAAYPIEAVGLANQGETFVLWDSETGQPLTPAIVWQDKRGQTVCDALVGQVDLRWLRHKTGLVLDSYFSAPKLRHVLEDDSDLRQRARSNRLRFGTTDSWVLWHLSAGRLHVTDPSTASRTMLFDINTLSWDDELLSLFLVPRSILPAVRPSAGPVGKIDLGTGRLLPVFALLVDQQAALFGQACFSAGDMKCTFGTGTFLLMNTGQAPRSSQRGLLTTVAWQLPQQTAYALDGGVFVTGAAVQWLADTLRLLPTVEASASVAEESRDHTVTFVPALAGLAAPYWQPDVRGAIFGLSRETAPADIVRATLEGIACRVRDVVEAMEQDAGQPVSFLKVDGGPAANRYLMQYLADIVQTEIRVAAEREATAIGIANLAAHAALGVSLEELSARWRAEAVYRPQISSAECQEHLERWQRAVAAAQRFHAA